MLAALPRGHAIEVRLYAEDPYDGFRPTTGQLTAWRPPAGPGVRVDSGVEEGAVLRTEYDPLLAKIMVHAGTRAEALARLRRALDELAVGGVQTDAGFLRWLVDHEGFASGAYDTSLVATDWRGGPPVDDDAALVAAAALHARADERPVTERAPATRQTGDSAWLRAARREGLRR